MEHVADKVASTLNRWWVVYDLESYAGLFALAALVLLWFLAWVVIAECFLRKAAAEKSTGPPRPMPKPRPRDDTCKELHKSTFRRGDLMIRRFLVVADGDPLMDSGLVGRAKFGAECPGNPEYRCYSRSIVEKHGTNHFVVELAYRFRGPLGGVQPTRPFPPPLPGSRVYGNWESASWLVCGECKKRPELWVHDDGYYLRCKKCGDSGGICEFSYDAATPWNAIQLAKAKSQDCGLGGDAWTAEWKAQEGDTVLFPEGKAFGGDYAELEHIHNENRLSVRHDGASLHVTGYVEGDEHLIAADKKIKVVAGVVYCNGKRICELRVKGDETEIPEARKITNMRVEGGMTVNGVAFPAGSITEGAFPPTFGWSCDWDKWRSCTPGRYRPLHHWKELYLSPELLRDHGHGVVLRSWSCQECHLIANQTAESSYFDDVAIDALTRAMRGKMSAKDQQELVDLLHAVSKAGRGALLCGCPSHDGRKSCGCVPKSRREARMGCCRWHPLRWLKARRAEKKEVRYVRAISRARTGLLAHQTAVVAKRRNRGKDWLYAEIMETFSERRRRWKTDGRANGPERRRLKVCLCRRCLKARKWLERSEESKV